MNNTIAIILAGGSGKRFGMLKQFLPINGIPICGYTLKKFNKFSILFVVPEQHHLIAKNIVCSLKLKNVFIISGGNTRQESVSKALNYIESNKIRCKNVIITDANRPCISEKTIDVFYKELNSKTSAVIAVCKSVNTSCGSNKKRKQLKHVYDRTYMYDMLMPQGFDYKLIYSAHKKTKLKNATDDTQLLNKNVFVKLIEIPYWEGLKLTNPEDYKVFERLLE